MSVNTYEISSYLDCDRLIMSDSLKMTYSLEHMDSSFRFAHVDNIFIIIHNKLILLDSGNTSY